MGEAYILHDVLDDAREYLLEKDMSEHHKEVVFVSGKLCTELSRTSLQ